LRETIKKETYRTGGRTGGPDRDGDEQVAAFDRDGNIGGSGGQTGTYLCNSEHEFMIVVRLNTIDECRKQRGGKRGKKKRENYVLLSCR
jgi:hypothetical protein